MKSKRAILAVLLVALAATVAATPARADVSFGFFYSNLEPHGSWLVSGSYGRVWQPAVYAPGWNPYYDGHWAYTDAGWMWASDYSWGAIPYHYGTWAMDPVYGWVWVPGYTWAPAWVTFRTGPDYIGWAPVAPGFSLSMSFGAPLPATSSFVFVPARSFMAPRIRTYAVPASRVRGVYRSTNVVSSPALRHDAVVTRGPDPSVVARASRQPVRHTSIESVSRMTPLDRRVTRGSTHVTAPQQTQMAWSRQPQARAYEQQRAAPQHGPKPHHGTDRH